MTHGIGWIGEHCYESGPSGGPGMRGSISLTAARGVEAEEFLARLGADEEQLRCRDLYRERNELAISPGVDMSEVSLAMYGILGEWVYILEDGGAASWFFGYRSGPRMEPLMGEEVICLTLNHHDAPSLILHAPGDDGKTREAEFGEGAVWSAELDTALRTAGAVFPSPYDGVSTEEESRRFYEEHMLELPARVFTGVGRYCGLTIDRASVEAGLLPLVMLPLPGTSPGVAV